MLGNGFCGSCKRAWVSLLALKKGLGNMAKWKRKKHDVPEEPHAEEHLSPLGLALLEQFAHGMSVAGLGLIFPHGIAAETFSCPLLFDTSILPHSCL